MRDRADAGTFVLQAAAREQWRLQTRPAARPPPGRAAVRFLLSLLYPVTVTVLAAAAGAAAVDTVGTAAGAAGAA